MERVIFKSGSLTLVGFVFKPDGPGPFPALVWNHGSEQSPGTMRQFDAVAAIFVPAGYVVFAPCGAATAIRKVRSCGGCCHRDCHSQAATLYTRPSLIATSSTKIRQSNSLRRWTTRAIYAKT
jgi:poly(3-hydroxybutyrate) depolymerase